MGALFSRGRSDSYYNNYEKAFEKLEKESGRVLDRRIKRRKLMGEHTYQPCRAAIRCWGVTGVRLPLCVLADRIASFAFYAVVVTTLCAILLTAAVSLPGI